eukprot:777251-Pleurochrysis_carterae.AAC.2
MYASVRPLPLLSSLSQQFTLPVAPCQRSASASPPPRNLCPCSVVAPEVYLGMLGSDFHMFLCLFLASIHPCVPASVHYPFRVTPPKSLDLSHSPTLPISRAHFSPCISSSGSTLSTPLVLFLSVQPFDFPPSHSSADVASSANFK